MNQIYEMTMQSFTSQSRNNEVPLKTVKSFSKINFEHESFMIPRFKRKRVSNFLSNNDVITDTPTLYESLLSGINIVRKVRLQSVGQGFGNDLINDIAKADRSIVRKDL